MAVEKKVQKGRKAGDAVNQNLQLVVKSGKITHGYKSTLKALRANKAKLIITSRNIQALRKSEIEYYAMLGKVDVHAYHGTGSDLAAACGKSFRTAVLAVLDVGDSDITEVVKTVG
eukprot:Filipodium_phascolosomae@DN6960_c0_g1_i1.p1